MAVQLGSGEYTFEVNENWAKLPEEITLGDCAAVGVDRQNRVYAFNRGEHPVAVFDAEGNLLRTWGEGVFHRPHGVHMGPDDTIWLTDDGDHTVRKCTLDGKVLMTLGHPRRAQTLHERRAVPPLHAHRLVAAGRPLRLGRLRQCAHPQIHSGRQAPDVMGRARHRSRPVQYSPQHLLRSRRLGLCRRPREPPGAGVRRQRQVRNPVEQSAPAERHVHGGRPRPALLHRRRRPLRRDQQGLAQYRPARQHPYARRARCWPGSARCIPGSLPASSPRRTASPSTGTATSMSANCRAGPGRASPRSRRPSVCASSTSSSRPAPDACPQRGSGGRGASVAKRNIVVERNSCPGFSSVVGKFGLLGLSGKCCVSSVNPSVWR